LLCNCSLTHQGLVKGGEGVLAAQLLLGLGALQCHLGALALVEGATWGHNNHVLGGNLVSLGLGGCHLLVQDLGKHLCSLGAVAHTTGLGGNADAAAGCGHCTGVTLSGHGIHTSLAGVCWCKWGCHLLASHTLVLTHLAGTLIQDGGKHLGSLGAVAHTTGLGGCLGCCGALGADCLGHIGQVSLGQLHHRAISRLAEARNWVTLLATISLGDIEATAGTHTDNTLLAVKEVS
jgi:hypothetical protein